MWYNKHSVGGYATDQERREITMIALNMTREDLIILSEHLQGNETEESELLVDKVVAAAVYFDEDHMEIITSYDL